jgi:L-amino acid N-acyltransferase YncA
MLIKNLKASDTERVELYVRLRNKMRKPLCSSAVVTIEQTKRWLLTNTVFVAVDRKGVHGAACLNDITGEITIFHNGKHRGLGGILLETLEKYADYSGVKRIWAWTTEDNVKSIGRFTKSGYKTGVFFFKKMEQQ